MSKSTLVIDMNKLKEIDISCKAQEDQLNPVLEIMNEKNVVHKFKLKAKLDKNGKVFIPFRTVTSLNPNAAHAISVKNADMASFRIVFSGGLSDITAFRHILEKYNLSANQANELFEIEAIKKQANR